LCDFYPKVLIAPTSFKESLSAAGVAQALADGICRVVPRCLILKLPLSDGGDGFLEAMTHQRGCSIMYLWVKGPLGDPVQAPIGVLDDGETAVIEMAKASGLQLVPPWRRNPLYTSTYGSGQLIRAAAQLGVKRIFFGIGGSATLDCGIGALQALGVRFLDRHGKPIPQGCGRFLGDIKGFRIPKIRIPELILVSDVKSRLLGPDGGALLFAPQKGATLRQVDNLRYTLRKFVELVRCKLGVDMCRYVGGGAGGGIAAGLKAFLGAKIVPGSQFMLKYTAFRRQLKGCNLILTGEGKIDRTTLEGKLVAEVVVVAERSKVPVAVVCGRCEGIPRSALRCVLLRDVIPLAQSDSDAVQNAYRYLVHIGSDIARRSLIQPALSFLS
jgi:glycerate kinase